MLSPKHSVTQHAPDYRTIYYIPVLLSLLSVQPKVDYSACPKLSLSSVASTIDAAYVLAIHST